MSVILIGGAGFVGTRLARRLVSQNCSTRILDKRMSAVFPEITEIVDVRDEHSFRKHLSADDTIVNLAAEHRDDVRPASLYEEVNVGGAHAVCDAADDQDIRKIIFTSSVAVYGFAPPETDESGQIAYFNEYGRTKHEAEQVYRDWQSRDPRKRSLVIIRPTVIFGEGNRGNVYNLFRQISKGRFLMIGDGANKKSLCYVENVAAFIDHCRGQGPGAHVFNYVDKPDLSMYQIVSCGREVLFTRAGVGPKLPRSLARLIGHISDFVSWVSNKQLPISSIRIQKFMATTQFATSAGVTGFEPPVDLMEALEATIRYEFQEHHPDDPIFETE